MQAVEGSIYSFNSQLDPVLGLLVPLCGTVDRINGLSGGLRGFEPPDDADDGIKGLYEQKLRQTGWEPTDVASGNGGGHLGATDPGFVSERIVPLIQEQGTADRSEGTEYTPPPRPQGRAGTLRLSPRAAT